MDPTSIWSRLTSISWGWPREWEELVLIAAAALVLTLLLHVLSLFIRITVRVVVVGLLVLLVYSAVRGARGQPILPPADEPTAPRQVEPQGEPAESGGADGPAKPGLAPAGAQEG